MHMFKLSLCITTFVVHNQVYMTIHSVNYQLSIRINDRHGSMRIDNGYYNKDYGLLAK